ncbi:MAG: ATP-binding protein [Myxococcales bacterium]|nr:ATP-binding protein [Myxococcales bacterium]
MNPIYNPFAPGAGTQPPELSGRDDVIRNATIALDRLRIGRPARSQMLLGLRGVGKTVLLNRIAHLAEERDYLTVLLEAPEDRRLAEMLVPPLRSMLFKLSRMERTKDVARRALAVLRAFAGALKVSAGEVEFGVNPETGTADSGSLEADLPELLMEVASAAKQADKAVALFVDEAHYLVERDLSALIVSIHKLGQRGLPFVVFGAGLPQLAALAGEARSYAERLFDYPDVGPLPPNAAADAIRTPLGREGVAIDQAALDLIVEQTKGYPYFLQEWAAQAWDVTERSPITIQDARRAKEQSVVQLDKGFFRVRLDRLTPRERDYMRAMAELGPGPHRSGDIAQTLSMDVTTAGPLRNGLIKKGMIFSPQHGDTAFTVPMFDEFMRRSMPEWVPGSPAAASKKKPRRKT